jgi:hypothetical protein
MNMLYKEEKHPQETLDLLKIGIETLNFFPPMYIQSILGPAYTWVIPPRKNSEFTILDIWKPIETLRYIRDITVPAVPHEPPNLLRVLFPDFINRFFWRPSTFFQQPDQHDSVRSFPDEHWFFINGIATNKDVSKMNTDCLATIFHRPITAIQNATSSTILDLVECAVGKEYKVMPNINHPGTMTEPALKAAVAILTALETPETKRVVLIAHSQGTIITANILRAVTRALEECKKTDGLEELTSQLIGEVKTEELKEIYYAFKSILLQFFDEDDDESGSSESKVLNKLKKLEIYTFANCANTMKYVDEKQQIPRIESFGNEKDLVSRLGMLSPELNKPDGLVTIDGAMYVNDTPWNKKHSCWGHLLNQHYLFAVDDYLSNSANQPTDNPYHLKKCQQGQYQAMPRLYQYFHGGTPTE